MVTDNKTGSCFITVDDYVSAVEFYLRNDFRFIERRENSGYEKWPKENSDYKNHEIFGEVPTFTMYFNLLTLIENSNI